MCWKSSLSQSPVWFWWIKVKYFNGIKRAHTLQSMKIRNNAVVNLTLCIYQHRWPMKQQWKAVIYVKAMSIFKRQKSDGAEIFTAPSNNWFSKLVCIMCQQKAANIFPQKKNKKEIRRYNWIWLDMLTNC